MCSDLNLKEKTLLQSQAFATGPSNLLNPSSWFMIRFPLKKFSSVAQKGEYTEGDMAKVSDLLGSRSDIYSLLENMTAHEAAKYLRERRVRAMAVCDNDGGILGVISQSDLSDKVAAENRHPDSVRVTEIMGKELIKVTTDTCLEECLSLMEEHGIYHLLVVDDRGKYKGMISAQDLLKVIASDYKARAELLESWAFPPI
jgi:CBS domain-containing protein